ncbi:hypothetical protein FKM82_022026 [Ascaphus truei]
MQPWIKLYQPSNRIGSLLVLSGVCPCTPSTRVGEGPSLYGEGTAAAVTQRKAPLPVPGISSPHPRW